MGYDDLGSPARQASSAFSNAGIAATEVSEKIQRMADTLARVHAADREAMVERMLTDPRGYGVLEHNFGAIVWDLELSPTVPFGEIHVHDVLRGGYCTICEA